MSRNDRFRLAYNALGRAAERFLDDPERFALAWACERAQARLYAVLKGAQP